MSQRPAAKTPEESAALAKAVARIRADWGYPSRWDLGDLLSDWERTVESVLSGYSLCFEDYTRELAIRDEFEGLIAEVPESLGSRIRGWLEPLDQAFYSATKRVAEPAMPPLDDEVLGEWWYRVPGVRHPVDPAVADTWRRRA